MSMPEQSGDSFDFCVLFRVYFTGKGAPPGMSPSYEMYRNLETYPVGCFIIYFYVSASRIIRILMR